MNRITSIRDQDPLNTKRFRNPRDTRGLIVAFFAGLAVAIAGTVAGLVSDAHSPSLPALVGGILVSMYSWTMLRGANNNIDTAPDEQVDEYERHVLDTWRKRALKAYSALTGIGGFATMMLGVLLDSPSSTALLACGYFMLFTFLIVYPLPMVGFAITFNRKEEEK
ncbi:MULTISPECIES: hypothetical protein [Corynebacterium]|uniref:Uncharacterized protein n=1 Tax=Corynebacterium ihumii TaxID=1232427 RepID=A0ABY7UBM1_9CORY|nr:MULTISPECIES: hypothetical protein [Corynebacterium]WCZ34085.1 hypothetical protein CIHUM_03240 [Corynebacterium ihumii]